MGVNLNVRLMGHLPAYVQRFPMLLPLAESRQRSPFYGQGKTSMPKPRQRRPLTP
jgi:hypothetical protein